MKKVINADKAEEFEQWTIPAVGGDTVYMPKDVLANFDTAEEVSVSATEKAYQDGYSHALQESEKKFKEEFEQKIQSYMNEKGSLIDQLVRQLTMTDLELNKQLETTITALIIKISTLLFKSEISHDYEKISGIVSQSLDLLPNGVTNIKLIVSPDDAGIVEPLLANKYPDGIINVVKDISLNRGECRVETNEATIDATLDTRINTIMEQIIHDDD